MNPRGPGPQWLHTRGDRARQCHPSPAQGKTGARGLAASSALAQDVLTLNPMAPSYKLLGFTYTPPKGDGWREIGYVLEALRLVYAEQIGDKINTHVDFTAQAFPVTPPTPTLEASQLAQMSMQQRLGEKGDTLVALSQVAPVEGAKIPVFEYTLIVKIDGADAVEHYFVSLAPDKQQYFAANGYFVLDTNFRSSTGTFSAARGLVGPLPRKPKRPTCASTLAQAEAMNCCASGPAGLPFSTGKAV